MADLSENTILEGIHECVRESLVYRLLNVHIKFLLKYLTNYPFFKGADVLYYLILKKYGKEAHYNSYNIHIVSIQSELTGVYILAEQDVKAYIIKDNPQNTIYPFITANIDRISNCKVYQLQLSIMTEELSFTELTTIPSIALNFPRYQKKLKINNHLSLDMMISNDYWDQIIDLSSNIGYLLNRMGFVKGSHPNMWNLILKDYYLNQLTRLGIHDLITHLPIRQIMSLNSLFPDIIRVSTKLNTLGIRLWYASKNIRAYLLGYCLSDGIPSDKHICGSILRLQELGIEKYAAEISKIHFTNEGLLTGQIGMLHYPSLTNKKLINYNDLSGCPLNSYYPQDLYPIVYTDSVVIITYKDILLAGISLYNIDELLPFIDNIQKCLTKTKFPYLLEDISSNDVKNISCWLCLSINTARTIPSKRRLLNIISQDSID